MSDIRTQIKSRTRVRDLAEVYTHNRQVDAMPTPSLTCT